MTALAEKIKINIEEVTPRRKHVVLHNDMYTSMDFVVQILIEIFDKSMEEAFDTMMHIHEEGEAIVGTYFAEIADTKVMQVHTAAAQHSFPLRASTTPA